MQVISRYGLFIAEQDGVVLGRGTTPDEAIATMPAKQAARKWTENENGELAPSGVELIDPDDFVTRRRRFYDAAKNQIAASYPLVHNNLKMEVADLEYEDPDEFDPETQVQTLLSDRTLARRLRGTVRLTDETTGQVLDEKRLSLMRVPHLTERGTFINSGNEYSTIMQSRLLPGAYTRRQNDGNLSTQFNVRPGTGRQFKVALEPSSGQYRLNVGTSSLHLYSLLKELGVEDDDLRQRWGGELFDVNSAKFDRRTLDKAYDRLVRPHLRVPDATPEQKRQAVAEAFNRMQLNENVARRNLPNLFDNRKSASWRTDQCPEFSPDRRPSEALEAWKVLTMPGLVEKTAAFRMSELQTLAAFITQATGVPINLQGSRDELESQIMAALGGGGSYNPAVYQAGVTAVENLKQASFEPSLDPDELREEFNALYGKAGPRLASMSCWPDHWLSDEDPLGWLEWYEKYDGGRRCADDERQIRRWASFRARNVPRFKRKPTARMAFALRNWAIDPLKLLEPPARERLVAEMEEYRNKARTAWEKEHGVVA